MPLQIILFGAANLFIEPLYHGCAAFLLTYRFSQSLIAKLIIISFGILFFLWIDDIWPNLAFRQAEMGIASGNQAVSDISYDSPLVGSAQFNNGRKTGLFQLGNLGAKDVISATLFVPLGFWIGMLITKRKWIQPKPQVVASLPPQLPTTPSKPPPPPQSHDAYKPK